MRLSHSQLTLFEQCPRKWKFRYKDKLRGPKISSPLFFGSALDDAFSHLLLSKKEDLTDTELDQQLTITAEEVFQQKMLVVDHNRQTVELAQSPFADYFASDFSPELMNLSHEKLLQSLEPSYKLVDFIDFHLQCKEQFRAKKKLQDDDQILYNYMNWLSLNEKGLLMVDAYRNDVIPQIHRVYDIQKRICLPNQDGDEITGLIDFTGSFVDKPGTKYIIDNKTSSKPYSLDSVKESQQLSTYCEAEGIDTAAYIVVEKKLFKKVPHIRTSVIKDTIPESTFDKTFDNFEKVCYSIEREEFPKNEDSCFAFGKMCEYFVYCKYQDDTGLVKLKDEK